MLAVDLDAPGPAAWRAAARTGRRGPAAGRFQTLLRKTVDSTLRHLAAEIRGRVARLGAAHRGGRPRAFPDSGGPPSGAQCSAWPTYRCTAASSAVTRIRCAARTCARSSPRPTLAAPDGTLPPSRRGRPVRRRRRLRRRSGPGLVRRPCPTRADARCGVGSPPGGGARAVIRPRRPAPAALPQSARARAGRRRQRQLRPRGISSPRRCGTPDARLLHARRPPGPLALPLTSRNGPGRRLADALPTPWYRSPGRDGCRGPDRRRARMTCSDEPEPGVAQGLLTGTAGPPRVPVVIKAGGSATTDPAAPVPAAGRCRVNRPLPCASPWAIPRVRPGDRGPRLRRSGAHRPGRRDRRPAARLSPGRRRAPARRVRRCARDVELIVREAAAPAMPARARWTTRAGARRLRTYRRAASTLASASLRHEVRALVTAPVKQKRRCVGRPTWAHGDPRRPGLAAHRSA